MIRKTTSIANAVKREISFNPLSRHWYICNFSRTKRGNILETACMRNANESTDEAELRDAVSRIRLHGSHVAAVKSDVLIWDGCVPVNLRSTSNL